MQCEYPDAPPNLTDLSQKVLNLYGTLRELERDFLQRYAQSNEQESDPLLGTKRGRDGLEDDAPGTEGLTEPQPKRIKSEPEWATTLTDAGSWSMYLSDQGGLAVDAVVRTFPEMTLFLRDFSQQIQSDDMDCPFDWEAEDQADDELDEDEYLVRIPVASIHHLLADVQKTEAPRTPSDRNISDKDLKSRVLSRHDAMRAYVNAFYDQIESKNVAIHILELARHIKSYIFEGDGKTSPMYWICLCSVYATAVTFEHQALQGDCVEYAKRLMMEEMQHNDFDEHPMAACIVLLSAWILGANTKILHMATRICCFNLHRDQHVREWQTIAASLLYYDTYASFFTEAHTTYGIGEAENWLESYANQLCDPQTAEPGATSAVLLKTQASCFLRQVLKLFYVRDASMVSSFRKVDVDHVLILVRDIETWEHRLPHWAQWDTHVDNVLCQRERFRLHLLHGITKILLYRPFCSVHNDTQQDEEEPEQTHTRTTFFDMSIATAERLITCIEGTLYTEWTVTATRLVDELFQRVRHTFGCDEDLMEQINALQACLDCNKD